MAMCDCCEAAPSAIEYEELNFCADCLVILPYALADLGHAIARFVRRAEVAGLVEEVESHLEDAIGSAESRLPATLDRAVDDLRTALDRLARLAGGVA